MIPHLVSGTTTSSIAEPCHEPAIPARRELLGDVDVFLDHVEEYLARWLDLVHRADDLTDEVVDQLLGAATFRVGRTGNPVAVPRL